MNGVAITWEDIIIKKGEHNFRFVDFFVFSVSPKRNLYVRAQLISSDTLEHFGGLDFIFEAEKVTYLTAYI